MPSALLGRSAAELAAQSAQRPFDCVIVGGGTSGLTAALTLAEHGRRVALVEAGPAPFLTHILNTELRYARRLSDSVRDQVQYSQQLASGGTFGPNFGCLGGRGLFWNGAAPRFRAHDFEGWPFSVRDLDEDYEWAEGEFRVTLALGDTCLARSMIARLGVAGIAAEPAPFAADVGAKGPGQLGSGIASGLGVFLRAAGAAVLDGRVSVAVGVRAERVLLAGAVARGVAVQGSDGARQEIFARSVVLAAGGIESIRLAALSRVPDAGGRMTLGIQDHLFFRSYWENPSLFDPTRADVAALYLPSVAQDAEQWEIHVPGRRLFALDDRTPWSPAAGEGWQFMMRSFAATEKRDENRVEVHEGGLGSATVQFTYSDADELRRQQVTARAAAIGAALAMTQVDARWATPGGSYHEAGGLDMGTDPRTSVTDPHGCFHQVPSLACLDAASFPRIGATNPHLTILAVARRQARALARRLA